MTKFGKFLVFANLVLALFFLALGIGVATNRVDWPGTMKTGPASEVKAGIALKTEEIKNYQQAASQALGRWTAAMADLLIVEKQQPERQKWFAEQIGILQTGKDASGKPYQGPIRGLVYKGGQLVLDKNGLPELQPLNLPGLELHPIPEMERMLADNQDLVKKEMEKIAGLMKEEG